MKAALMLLFSKKANLRRHLLLLAGAALVSSACTPSADQPVSPLTVEDCRRPGIQRGLRCGTLTVPENPAELQGRTIPLNFVVLPAKDETLRPDAVLYLVGGPGLAATGSLPLFSSNLQRLQKTRDIVLVDQRGTGASNPLNCALEPLGFLGAILEGKFDPATIERCSGKLDADSSLYTSSQIVDDLDAVRSALGYAHFDLVAISYGSRLALDYLRRYPQRVRTISLRGVASPAGTLLADIGTASDDAMNRLFDRCSKDPYCESKHPDLEQTFKRTLSRLDSEPQEIELEASDGHPFSLTLSRDLFAGVVRFALYSSSSARTIPVLIEDAEHGRWDSTAAALANFLGPGLTSRLSFGSYLSIACAEDVPFFTPPPEPDPARFFFTSSVVENLRAACRIWRHRPVPRAFKQPVRSSVPALLMSGNEDPATSASSAEMIGTHLSDSRHLVTPGLAHFPFWTDCFARNVALLVESGSTDAVDEACVADYEPAGFVR